MLISVLSSCIDMVNPSKAQNAEGFIISKGKLLPLEPLSEKQSSK